MEKTKVKPKTEQEKAQEFLKRYEALCEELGFQIVVTPAWRATNHGSFELVQQSSIGRLPKRGE